MLQSSRLQGIAHAQHLAEQCLKRLEAELSCGMTEVEIAARLRNICLSQPDVQQALTDMVISGPNSAGFHSFASDRRIGSGDLILIDFSLVINGWYSDMTRMYAIGEPPPEARHICEVVARAHRQAAGLLRPGVTGAELYQAAMRVIDAYGYKAYFPHALGHGIGHEMHEAPSLCADNLEPIPMGTVFSIEPGIYLPNSFGARLENLYYMDEKGAVCLNNTPAALKILPENKE